MKSLPFQIEIRPGRPAYEQVIQAVHRAMARGILNEGDAFPSVRDLGKLVRINPNTAHRVVQELVAEGTLEVMPGRGTRVAPYRRLSASQRGRMIQADMEALVIEAKRLGYDLNGLKDVMSDTWKTMGADSK